MRILTTKKQKLNLSGSAFKDFYTFPSSRNVGDLIANFSKGRTFKVIRGHKVLESIPKEQRQEFISSCHTLLEVGGRLWLSVDSMGKAKRMTGSLTTKFGFAKAKVTSMSEDIVVVAKK